MKKVLLLALLVTSSLFAHAQKNKKSPEERAQARVEKISQELNLSDTQKSEIYELFLVEGKKGRVEGKNIRDLSKEERQAYIEAKKGEKAAVYEKIADILDEEQFATFQTMDKSRKPVKTSKGKKGGKSVENRVQSLTEKLQLSETQQDQVADILTKQQEARIANSENRGQELTEEAKEARKAARKDAKAQLDADMKAVLSAEQYATYQAEGNRKGKGKKKKKGKKGKKKEIEE